MKTLRALMNTEHYHHVAAILFLVLLNAFMIKLLFAQYFFIALGKVIMATVVPFLFSFTIVYVFRPLLLWIERKSHIKSWISTFLFMASMLICLVILIDFFIPLLFTQFNHLIREFPQYKEHFNLQVVQFENKHDLLHSGTISRLVEQFFHQAATVSETNTIHLILKLLKQTISFLWVSLLIPIIMFMMVKDYDLILQSAVKLVPTKEKEAFIDLFKRIDQQLGLYIRGQLLVFTYMFFGSFALFSLIGLKHSFLFALLFAFTNFIPYLGPYLGGIPVGLYAYLQSTHTFIFVLLIIFFLQQFDGDIGQPIIFGKQLNLHPLIIIICMAIGSVLFGVIGLIIAIPVFIICKEIFFTYNQRIYKRFRLVNR